MVHSYAPESPGNHHKLDEAVDSCQKRVLPHKTNAEPSQPNTFRLHFASTAMDGCQCSHCKKADEGRTHLDYMKFDGAVPEGRSGAN